VICAARHPSLRVPDLASFRQVILERAIEGAVADIRRRAVIVPSHAAAEQLRRTIEDHRLSAGPGAVLLPALLTRDEWRAALHGRSPAAAGRRGRVRARGVAAGRLAAAIAEGFPPPFTVRPGLITEMLGFYDGVRRHGRTVTGLRTRGRDGPRERRRHRPRGRSYARPDAVPRGRVPPVRGAARDRGLLDEHGLTAATLAVPASRFTHVIVAVGDRAGDASGLWPSDFDLLTRIAGLSRLDVVATNGVLRAGLLERLRRLASGARRRRRRAVRNAGGAPLLAPAEGDAPFWRRAIARRNWRRSCASSSGPTGSSRTCRSRARGGLQAAAFLTSTWQGRSSRSAGVPHQTFDALPLAAEPYAAALDLVFDAVDLELRQVGARQPPALAAVHLPRRRPAGHAVRGGAPRPRTERGALPGRARQAGGVRTREAVARRPASGGARRGRRRGRAGIAVGRRTAHGAP